MKLFSQGPVFWFDSGGATVVMAVIVAGFLTYRMLFRLNGREFVDSKTHRRVIRCLKNRWRFFVKSIG